MRTAQKYVQTKLSLFIVDMDRKHDKHRFKATYHLTKSEIKHCRQIRPPANSLNQDAMRSRLADGAAKRACHVGNNLALTLV
jgi:hypothetical protein